MLKHIGINAKDRRIMLQYLNFHDIHALISNVVPKRISCSMEHKEECSEQQALTDLNNLMSENNDNQNIFYGQGYHPTNTPPILVRNLLENPKWYSPYTPYQSEISQGRLESLHNFQTLIQELTALPVSNASLLDESIAGTEALNLSYQHFKGSRNSYFCSKDCHPQIINTLQHKADVMGIDLIVDKPNNVNINEGLIGALLPYPDTYGKVSLDDELIGELKKNNSIITCNADILSLMILKPPGEWGADICFGTTQRFGTPMWFGGPHAAFFSTKKEFIRKVPGRIVGVSKDKLGNPAYRLALQTREQHIKKDKATSNICTAQALLANLVSMYAIHHGKEGLVNIAEGVHNLTKILAGRLHQLGFFVVNSECFDTIHIRCHDDTKSRILNYLEHNNIFIREVSDGLCITIDETKTISDIDNLTNHLGEVSRINDNAIILETSIDKFWRDDNFLEQDIFNSTYSETDLMRYMSSLADKDYGLTNGMIPLGSCTMKLNATSELMPLSWKSMQNAHPYIKSNHYPGYLNMINELKEMLCNITGFSGVSLQPNSGAMGEYTGLLCIKKYHESNGEGNRNICLIPESAHGTNFASATMAGLKIKKFKTEKEFEELVINNKENLFGLMITYPNTYGIFDENICDITKKIKGAGGMVYMDGANMNAQVGLTSPFICGADVCHLNLHKTFCIPHGGGGPGMGPILVCDDLESFLPESMQNKGSENSIQQISSSEWSSASILSISYLYLKMMGSCKLKEATETAILSANYMKERLAPYFDVAFTNKNGYVGHEFIINVSKYKKIGITDNDIAKRIIDYGFHPPTMSWPISGALMIEPTESESLAELDRFCEAMAMIYYELEEVENGKYPQDNNVFVNAPHTMQHTINWNFPYTIQKACFPSSRLIKNKFWPSVARVDNVIGDNNLLKS